MGYPAFMHFGKFFRLYVVAKNFRYQGSIRWSITLHLFDSLVHLMACAHLLPNQNIYGPSKNPGANQVATMPSFRCLPLTSTLTSFVLLMSTLLSVACLMAHSWKVL